ncbi:MAG TPA: histidinol-phosphate transaminase, partial [Lachnospiraceae bacterium]|nr:histidinol-phosphate transaminase [Lachnospiraceae bacterium]
KNPNGGVVIANPNAPTSIAESADFIEDIIKHNQDSVVIIDEAYVDFGGESVLPLIKKYDNLLVVRTFSKSRSMAGMRIGYAFGNAELIKALNDVKYSFNSYTLNMTAITTGAASALDEEYFEKTCRKIIATREEYKEKLEKLGFYVLDSKTNFLFASPRGAKFDSNRAEETRKLFEALKKENIFVRYFNKPRINEFLRITIGTPEQMETFIKFIENYINV